MTAEQSARDAPDRNQAAGRFGVRDAFRHHVARLKRFYGPLPAPPSDPFALYVWEALSSQTAPSRRDAALAALRRIPALTPDAVRRAPRAKLEAAVALAGSLAAQRLDAILRAAESFRRHPDLRSRPGGSMLGVRRALRDLPQVGEGWAQRVLIRLMPRAICPRDAGVARVASRLGLLQPSMGHDPSPLEGASHHRLSRPAAALMAGSFAPDVGALQEAFLYVTHHAAVSCTPFDPHCGACPLAGVCAHRGRRSNRAGR